MAHTLWFRGISALPVTDVTILGLLSPVVATVLGWVALGETLTGGQIAGALVVLAALVAARHRTAPPQPAGDERSQQPPVRGTEVMT